MAKSLRTLLLVSLLAACGFPRPADVESDAMPGDPGLTIRVSPTGDDVNDGLAQPVKTLKRAIGLAAANRQITTIALAGGRYASAGGETFPYTVPNSVSIVGPAGGGAILAGTDTEPGMVVDAGTLQDLELEQFTVAITATGSAHLANLRIRTGALAIRAETAAKLTLDNVDIAGSIGACASGVEMTGAADVTVSRLVTRALGVSVHAMAQSTLAVDSARVTGDVACGDPFLGALTIGTTEGFALKESLIENADIGVWFVGTATPTKADIVNTTIRNTVNDAIVAHNVSLRVTGGELSNGNTAIGVVGAGDYQLANVVVKQQRGFAIEIGDGSVVRMRECTFMDNGGGIYLVGNTILNLGTAESPGNNVFQNGQTTGLEVDGSLGAIGGGRVDAVGNTWRPEIQGADGVGRYTPTTISGRVGYTMDSNFSIPENWTIRL